MLLAESLASCMDALEASASSPSHLVNKINMSWMAETSIMPAVPNLTRLKVSGHLPELAVHFSDRKYQELMRIVDIAVPKFDEDSPVQSSGNQGDTVEPTMPTERRKSVGFGTAQLYGDAESIHELEVDNRSVISGADNKDDTDVFYEAPDLSDGVSDSLYR